MMKVEKGICYLCERPTEKRPCPECAQFVEIMKQRGHTHDAERKRELRDQLELLKQAIIAKGGRITEEHDYAWTDGKVEWGGEHPHALPYGRVPLALIMEGVDEEKDEDESETAAAVRKASELLRQVLIALEPLTPAKSADGSEQVFARVIDAFAEVENLSQYLMQGGYPEAGDYKPVQPMCVVMIEDERELEGGE